MTGTRRMEFTFWDSAAGGKSLWASGKLEVEVSEGVFSVLIGPEGDWPFDWSDPGLSPWLETAVEGESLSPRESLAAVPFAQAATSVQAVGSGRVRLSGSPADLSTWQSRADPSKIDPGAILGGVTPAASGPPQPMAHALTHGEGAGDAVTLGSGQVSLSGSNQTLKNWQSHDDPSKINASMILGSVPGGAAPFSHAASHAAGGSDPVPPHAHASTHAAGGADPVPPHAHASMHLSGGGDPLVLSAGAVKLPGTDAFVSSWQSGADPAKIDPARIQGSVVPQTHAATHRADGGDPVQLIPSQVDGTCLIASPQASQTIQPIGNGIPLTIKGKPGSSADLLSLHDSAGAPAEQIVVDSAGNATFRRQLRVEGKLDIRGEVGGLSAGVVKLPGADVFISSWQSGADPAKIDPEKLQGPATPKTHAATHHEDGPDPVSVAPDQVEGTALVKTGQNSQTVQGSLTVTGELSVQQGIATTGIDVGSRLVPSGLIAMFTEDCPSGWTKLGLMDGRFPIGTVEPTQAGDAGGSASHTHGMSHTHTGTTDLAAVEGYHTHSQNWDHEDGRLLTGIGVDAPILSPSSDAHHRHGFGTSGPSQEDTPSSAHYPPHIKVIFCKKN